MKNKMKKNTLLRLYKFLGKRSIPYFIGLLGMSCMMLAFNGVMALGLKNLTNAIISKKMNAVIDNVIFITVGMFFIILILPILNYLYESTLEKTTGNIRKTLFEHIQKLPIKYIEDNHSGDLISRLTNDVQTAQNAYGNQLLMLLMAIISGIGGAIAVTSINWKLSVIAISIGILTTYINTKFIKPIKKSSDKIQELISIVNQKLTDTLDGLQVIRMFNLNKIIENNFETKCNDVKKASINLIIKNSFLNGLNTIMGSMSFLVLIVIGCFMVINDELNFGELMAFIQMCNCITWMFNSIGSFFTQLQTSLAGADRIFYILDMPIEEENSIIINNVSNNMPDNTVINFHKVKFSYEDNKDILKDINFTLSKNQVLAFVGSSGSGKSTILKILLKFYNLNSGHINIFNKSILEYNTKELRKLISYVSQDNYLFSGTIKENIGYGKENATIEEIIEAAKAANAHDFITELPNGYDTEVGERGAHLSGGQRQRISIARAILKNAPILLLDEATSSLDSESEKYVQDALEVLMKNRSTIVVAHRLSTIKNADKILVLDDGKIVEEGTHEYLLSLGNAYANLYNLQFNDN